MSSYNCLAFLKSTEIIKNCLPTHHFTTRRIMIPHETPWCRKGEITRTTNSQPTRYTFSIACSFKQGGKKSAEGFLKRRNRDFRKSPCNTLNCEPILSNMLVLSFRLSNLANCGPIETALHRPVLFSVHIAPALSMVPKCYQAPHVVVQGFPSSTKRVTRFSQRTQLQQLLHGLFKS